MKTFSQNNPYFVLIPYMEIMMNHTIYFLFFILSHYVFSHFSSSDQFFAQKYTQEKTLVLIILNDQKIKKELGDLLGP